MINIMILLIISMGTFLCGSESYTMYVSTEDGLGADTHISRETGRGSWTRLGVRFNQHKTHHQKVYLRFDMRHRKRVEGDTDRSRRAKSSKCGLALDLVVDNKTRRQHSAGTFNIFVLKKHSSYGNKKKKEGYKWDEQELNWKNAPANHQHVAGGEFIQGHKEKNGGVIPDYATHVGTFTTVDGAHGTILTPPSEEFMKALRKTADGKLITVIITRVNKDDMSPLYIASKEHKEFQAPRLVFYK